MKINYILLLSFLFYLSSSPESGHTEDQLKTLKEFRSSPIFTEIQIDLRLELIKASDEGKILAVFYDGIYCNDYCNNMIGLMERNDDFRNNIKIIRVVLDRIYHEGAGLYDLNGDWIDKKEIWKEDGLDITLGKYGCRVFPCLIMFKDIEDIKEEMNRKDMVAHLILGDITKGKNTEKYIKSVIEYTQEKHYRNYTFSEWREKKEKKKPAAP